MEYRPWSDVNVVQVESGAVVPTDLGGVGDAAIVALPNSMFPQIGKRAAIVNVLVQKGFIGI
jgi:hypothetical protein